MEPPINDWFRSLPYAIDSLANSVKVLGLFSEEVYVTHRVYIVPASDDGVAPQILQRKDPQTAFRY